MAHNTNGEVVVHSTLKTARSTLFRVVKRIWDGRYTYCAAWTVGLLLMFFVAVLFISGRFRVVGYWRYIGALLRGKVVVVANHPSLIESLLLSILGIFFFPVAAPLLWPYAMPDRRTFLPKRFWNLYPLARCITVDRGEGQEARACSVAAVRTIIDALKAGSSAIIHVEGGRSWKREVFRRLDGRMIAEPQGGVVTIIRKSGARVLPVWLEYGCQPWEEVDGKRQQTPLWRRLLSGMTIYVGEVFVPRHDALAQEVVTEIADRILVAKRSP